MLKRKRKRGKGKGRIKEKGKWMGSSRGVVMHRRSKDSPGYV